MLMHAYLKKFTHSENLHLHLNGKLSPTLPLPVLHVVLVTKFISSEIPEGRWVLSTVLHFSLRDGSSTPIKFQIKFVTLNGVLILGICQFQQPCQFLQQPIWAKKSSSEISQDLVTVSQFRPSTIMYSSGICSRTLLHFHSNQAKIKWKLAQNGTNFLRAENTAICPQSAVAQTWSSSGAGGEPTISPSSTPWKLLFWFCTWDFSLSWAPANGKCSVLFWE